MNINYEINGRPRAEEVCGVMAAAGWRDPARHGLELVQHVWDEAPFTVLAREGERLVGMCRALCDGRLRAEVKNLFVHPDYQGQGVGTRLITLLLCELEAAIVGPITLDSVVGKEDFYKRFGFVVHDDMTPMVRRRTEADSDHPRKCCDEESQ